jgi:RimJ/RimL family protein N-acetyltransferase
MFSKTISSEKIILRPYEIGDIPFWQKWDIDPQVQAFLPEPKNEPQTPEEMAAYLKECQDENDGYYWTIVWKDTNQPIGTISLTEVNPYHGIGELGIVIGEREYWGKGIAQESIKLIVSLMPVLGIRRVSAEFEERNIAMEKVLIKSGFQKEAILNSSRIKDGHPINTIRYFYLKSDSDIH